MLIVWLLAAASTVSVSGAEGSTTSIQGHEVVRVAVKKPDWSSQPSRVTAQHRGIRKKKRQSRIRFQGMAHVQTLPLGMAHVPDPELYTCCNM